MDANASLIVLAALAACGGSKPATQPELAPTPVAAAEAPMAQDVPAPAPAPAPEPKPEPEPEPLVSKLPPVDFVTPLSLENVTEAAKAKSKKLNKAGLRLHRKNKYDAAEAKYVAALAADPANLFPRYNLACVYNMTGRHDQGLALLYEMAKAGCDDCALRVGRAEWDKEWQSHWMEPVLWEILGYEAPTESSGDADEPKEWWEPGEFKCPKGTRVKGERPKDAHDTGWLHCEKPNGVLHGPSVQTENQDAAHDILLTTSGEYRNGKKHGYWSEQSGMEAWESGYYEHGVRQGRWSCSLQYQEEYKGYVDGQLHGRQLDFDYDHDAEESFRSRVSHYDHGDAHGPYTSWSAKNRLESQGEYAKGKLHGVWTEYRDETGKKWRVHAYERGVPHGVFEFWDPSGKSIARFEMKHGTGDWVVYDEAGTVTERGRLEKMEKHGAWVEWDQGAKEAGEYKQDKRIGAWSGHDNKGNKLWEGQYKRGSESGTWTYWFDDGTQRAKGAYKNGEPDGKWVVADSSGEEPDDLEFRRGKLIRVFGERASKDYLRGWAQVELDFPTTVREITQEELDEMKEEEDY